MICLDIVAMKNETAGTSVRTKRATANQRPVKDMHPALKLLDWLTGVDFALLGHGFQQHGRDYFWHIQDCLGPDPGEHEIVFTHCVQADYETRVGDGFWHKSWDDVYLDYEKWTAAGEPDEYVWGTNWTNACPGLKIVGDSPIAIDWSKRIGKPFYEITLETDRFFLRLLFHDIRFRKLSESTEPISSTIMPM
jgi:hypothetical protein